MCKMNDQQTEALPVEVADHAHDCTCHDCQVTAAGEWAPPEIDEDDSQFDDTELTDLDDEDGWMGEGEIDDGGW